MSKGSFEKPCNSGIYAFKRRPEHGEELFHRCEANPAVLEDRELCEYIRSIPEFEMLQGPQEDEILDPNRIETDLIYNGHLSKRQETRK